MWEEEKLMLAVDVQV